MGEALGIAAAIMFGTSHFFNGVLSRRAPALSIAVYSQAGGAVFFLGWGLAVFWGRGELEPMGQDDAGWAVLSGVGAAVGVTALYEGMSRAHIAVVVPVTSIVSVAVPFILSVILLHEPLPLFTAVAGIMLLPAIWLLSRPPRHSTADQVPPDTRQGVAAVGFGLVAGAGYATQLFALSQITTVAPAEPLLTGQLVSLVLLLGLAWVRGTSLKPRSSTGLGAAVGVMAAVAMAFYLFATRHALLGPVMIAVALYPALPVILAVLLLKERLSRLQAAGLLIAAIVVPVVSLSS